MADQKLTALTADGTPVAADLLYIVDDVAGTATSKKITLANLALGLGQTLASSSGPMSLDFAEDTDNGTNRIRVIGQSSVASDKTLTLPDATGTVLSDAAFVYASYTPAVAQNGARTTSALNGKYIQIGKWVHCYGNATISNTGTANNVLTVTVPVNAAGGYGSGFVNDVSATQQYACHMVFQSATTIAFYATNASNSTAWGVTPNIAVASGDVIQWSVTYEAA